MFIYRCIVDDTRNIFPTVLKYAKCESLLTTLITYKEYINRHIDEIVVFTIQLRLL